MEEQTNGPRGAKCLGGWGHRGKEGEDSDGEAQEAEREARRRVLGKLCEPEKGRGEEK